MKTANENRRANVKKLIEQFGGQAEFAKKIGKDPAQISQWATAAKSHRGKPRGMSDGMARYIETNCGLDRGWMDIEHDASSGAVPYRVLSISRSDEDGGERPMRRRGSFDGKSMGQRIAELREAKGWKQAELARRVGVTRMTANQWESGVIKNIKNPTFSRLAAVLGCSERYLAGVGERGPRHADQVRLEFLALMRANAQFTSDAKWIVWYSRKGRVFLKPGDTLGAAIDSAMESLKE